MSPRLGVSNSQFVTMIRPNPMAFNEVRLLLNKGIMGRHFKNISYIYFLFPVQVELKTISAVKVNSATPAPIPRITNIP